MVPEAAAGIRSGIACASARSRTSTMRCEVSTFPPATAAGGRAFTTVPDGRDHLDRPHQSGGRRHIFGQQAAEYIEASGVGDGLDRIDTALNLRIGAGKIHGDRVAAGTRPRSLKRHRHRNLHRLSLIPSLSMKSSARYVPFGTCAKNARIICSE